MATVPQRRLHNDYPSADGKPMAETDWHRDLMVMLIETLQDFYAGRQVYVSGNLLVFYEGDRRRHVSPDVFVVRAVDPEQRPNYLIWEEGRAPKVVIELTSSSTRREDQNTKMNLYQNVLRVREYVLFDPRADYLDPPLQGYRLRKGVYQPIRPQRGRLPSQVLGLHLERAGETLRLWNPATQSRLPIPGEQRRFAEERAEQEARARVEAEHVATIAQQRAEAAERRAAELAAELERLRRGSPERP